MRLSKLFDYRALIVNVRAVHIDNHHSLQSDGLSKAINRGVEQGRLANAAWARRRKAFQELLAVPEAALAWKYLNRGTHDGDGEDFEIGIVQQVIAALTKLSDSFARDPPSS